jgi:NAD(P)-dependent dehydrogenase (short-subunit alcohol dehydrogenase family)
MVVLTGATRGIGRAAALEFARRGAELALVGRDGERVEATVEEARAAGGDGARVNGHVADLVRMDEERRLAAELLERLVAARARVVTTSSDAHKSGVLDLDDLQSEQGRFRAGRAYGTSKLCNVLFTRELQRRHPELTANCFHPGVIRTGFGKSDGALAKLSMTLIGPFLRSPEAGARSLVWLALDPAAGELHGQYVEKERVAEPSAQAQDDRLARELWERSQALVAQAA